MSARNVPLIDQGPRVSSSKSSTLVEVKAQATSRVKASPATGSQRRLTRGGAMLVRSE